MAKPTPPRTPNTSSLECTLERIKEEFVQNLLHQSNVSSLDPKEIRSLLNTFYRPGHSPSGLIAQTRQKILIVENSASVAAGLKNRDSVEVTHGAGKQNARVKRVSEYPNACSEFKDKSGNPISTKTILIEWEVGPNFIEHVNSLQKGLHEIEVMDQAEQADNFIINPRNPASEPDPPIRSLVLGSALLALPIAKSDYSIDAYEIIGSTLPDYPNDTIKVVVSDTGLKLKIDTPFGQQNELPDQVYTTWDGLTTHFPIAPNANPADSNPIGFCSLTNYLDDTYPLPPRPASFPTGIPTDDSKVLRNPTDDHYGRHGTCIAAIVAQNPAGASAIVPLKIFDFMGFGTLFDILCGFNYIFARIEAGENIRVVNASWGAAVPEGDSDFRVYQLLEKKIEVLQTKNVFVLAAAGNRDTIHQTIGRNISDEPAVPACYSKDYDNVITVTTVAEKWRKILFNPRSRSRYINPRLRAKLLRTGNPLEWLLNLISNIVPDGYTAVENYSSDYVGVGVVAHPMGGLFPMPFRGSKQQAPLTGSSFATAFMSAYVVSCLKENHNSTRAEILDSLSTHASLNGHVQKGRYLELDKVTGKSIEENFESVLHGILSTFP